MSYVVTAKMVHVQVPAKWTVGNRPIMETAIRVKGALLPDGVKPEAIQNLLDAGLIAELPPGVETPVA